MKRYSKPIVYRGKSKDIVLDMKRVNDSYNDEQIRGYFMEYLRKKYNASSTRYVIDYYVNKKEVKDIATEYGVTTTAVNNAIEKVLSFVGREMEIQTEEKFEGLKYEHPNMGYKKETAEDIILNLNLYNDLQTYLIKRSVVVTDKQREEALVEIFKEIIYNGRRTYIQEQAEIINKCLKRISQNDGNE